MALTLYNTLGREKQAFEPIDPKNVRMYVCGPTVYDLAHIGNARPVVVFDVLYRLLRRHYGIDNVKYVRNITDVDDKIIAASKETGESIDHLTARTEKAFHEDMAALGALDPDEEPRATRHIPEMIDLIECLIAKTHAYVADGHVLFDTTSMKDYGRLSRHNRAELVAGARVEVAPYKNDPADFVLWKPSTADQPGWDSPWGRGRPGWHLECSAMSKKSLGVPFDIHGGGQDLIFPHHENEIAQSTCADPEHGFAHYWVHNGYLVVEGEKMSKSLGNFYTVNDLLAEFPGEALRLALLETHYRQPLDFTKAGVTRARHLLARLYKPLLEAREFEAASDALSSTMLAVLEDDLNTPLALRHLRELATRLNKAMRAGDGAGSARFKGELIASGAILGLLQVEPEAWFKAAPGEVDVAEVDNLIEARMAARGRKDFAEADRIRAELAEQGVVLEDRPDGTTDWRTMG